MEAYQQDIMNMFYLGGGAVLVLFWGGYASKRLVFSTNKSEKLIAHSLMHLIVNGAGCMLLLRKGFTLENKK